MSWRGGRWRRRSGTWGWPGGGRRRCRPGGAGRCGCCSGWSGCRWPARRGTCRPRAGGGGACSARAGRAAAARVALLVVYGGGLVELGRGRDREALAAFQAAERMARRLAAPQGITPRMRVLLLLTLVRLGETERAGRVLADLGEQGRDGGEIRLATAALRLAQDDPHAAAAALAPVLDGSAPVPRWAWLIQAFLLEAIARDALGDPAAAGRAVERALDLAEPDGALGAFLLHPAPGLLERHARHC